MKFNALEDGRFSIPVKRSAIEIAVRYLDENVCEETFMDFVNSISASFEGAEIGKKIRFEDDCLARPLELTLAELDEAELAKRAEKRVEARRCKDTGYSCREWVMTSKGGYIPHDIPAAKGTDIAAEYALEIVNRDNEVVDTLHTSGTAGNEAGYLKKWIYDNVTSPKHHDTYLTREWGYYLRHTDAKCYLAFRAEVDASPESDTLNDDPIHACQNCAERGWEQPKDEAF